MTNLGITKPYQQGKYINFATSLDKTAAKINELRTTHNVKVITQQPVSVCQPSGNPGIIIYTSLLIKEL